MDNQSDNEKPLIDYNRAHYINADLVPLNDYDGHNSTSTVEALEKNSWSLAIL